MPRKIVAGPWQGEMGWQLMRWQGIFRNLARKGHEITMVARPGNQVLYKDYVREYVTTEEIGLKDSGETDGWKLNGKEPLIPQEILTERFTGCQYMKPTTCMRIGIDPCGPNQKFIRYGKKYETTGHNYIVIHPRNTKKVGTEYRNWPEKNWDSLVQEISQLGLSVVTIGTTETYLPENTKDERGKPLSEVVDILHNAKLALGPSSGPMHLASLCGTTHILWSDNKFWGSCNGTNRQRYETNWNPLGTKAIVLDEDNWQPPVEKVTAAIKDYLDG